VRVGGKHTYVFLRGWTRAVEEEMAGESREEEKSLEGGARER